MSFTEPVPASASASATYLFGPGQPTEQRIEPAAKAALSLTQAQLASTGASLVEERYVQRHHAREHIDHLYEFDKQGEYCDLTIVITGGARSGANTPDNQAHKDTDVEMSQSSASGASCSGGLGNLSESGAVGNMGGSAGLGNMGGSGAVRTASGAE